jgi:SpoVK/Ycf46/Vps4 family AAA+-type ATPase
VQGCGKSLAAKAAAGILGMQLLRLAFAPLHNKYIGESERNLRETLATSDVLAPCVLWIDEIEKGVATVERCATRPLAQVMAEKIADCARGLAIELSQPK